SLSSSMEASSAGSASALNLHHHPYCCLAFFTDAWDLRWTSSIRSYNNSSIQVSTLLVSYEKEVERETAKTADMKEKGANPYDLKQQENVLAESRMMIPDCHKRLEAALVDLKGALAELEKSNEKEGSEIDDA
ncbi:hypothetical protein S83_064038, partial [Arachis hypogaea]